MRVAILSGDTLIGHATLDRLDPPMGCAAGLLEPTEAYAAKMHAVELDGEPLNVDVASQLSVRDRDDLSVACHAVSIQDWNRSLGEIHANVLGIPYPAYKSYFGSHPHFREYWGR